jgi:4-amino-4-deoxy-L-arabinose transferase-like glycosyltransferase
MNTEGAMTPVGAPHRYERAAAILLICLVWAVAALPGLSLRSFIWEEGTNAEIARSILADGDFLQPSIYGLRWHEKPSLLAWLIAGVAALTGQVDEWSARLPAMASVLLTALLVQSLARQVASLRASVFAGLAFMFCPMVLQKLTIAEPDTVVTLLSFAAFAVWWNGEARGRLSIGRWLVCGAILAVMALAKGPQPVGFFALGTGGYLLLERRWRDLPGLSACLVLPAATVIAWAAAVYRPGDTDLWLAYMRVADTTPLHYYVTHNPSTALQIPLGLLPSTLLLWFVPWPWRRRAAAVDVPPIVAPFALYASLCTIALVFWPGANARYAMPIAPAVAVLAGIGWDRLEGRHVMLRQAAGAVVAACFAYQLVLTTMVMPILADRFGASRLAGTAIEAAIAADPAPAYCVQWDTNQLFYMHRPIRCIDLAEIKALPLPSWLVTPRHIVDALAALRPGAKIGARVETRSGEELVAVRLEAN